MRFFVERTARAIFTIWLALTLAFALIRFLPGGPLDQIRFEITQDRPGIGPEQLQAALASRARDLGIDLNAPLHEQYIDYVVGLVQGDMGYSVGVGEEVAPIMAEALPWTIFVMVTATVLIFVIAILVGSIIAYREGTKLDSFSSSISILMAAIPFYVLAFVLIMAVGYGTGWFPTQFTTGRGVDSGDGITFILDAIYHAALPIASVVLTQAGTWVLSMRGNSIQILGEDYVRVARLRGLSDRRISTRYVARNAILPMYTGFLTLIGFNLGASVILERVFTYKGIGWYMYQGLITYNGDYPLVMGTFIIYAVALVIAVWIADLTYSYVDPRVKTGGQSEAY